jgi:hypothetical protein
MNTPPSPPPAATPAPTPTWVRWAALRADLLGLVVVALVSAPVGGVAYALLRVEDPRGFENLAAALGAAVATAVAALSAAVFLTVATARNTSWVDRAAGHRHDGGARTAAARFGRWLLLLAAVPAVFNGAVPGWIRDVPTIIGTAVGCLVGVVALVVVYTDRTHPRRTGRSAMVVGTAATVATLAAVATLSVPLRPFQIDSRVERALPELLEEVGADRVCAAQGTVQGQTASHTTAPCHDPDEVWASPDGLLVTADRIAAGVGRVVPEGTTVRVSETATTNGPAAAVELVHAASTTPRTVAHVAATDCGTRVLVGRSASRPPDVGRFLPDIELGSGCV